MKMQLIEGTKISSKRCIAFCLHVGMRFKYFVLYVLITEFGTLKSNQVSLVLLVNSFC